MANEVATRGQLLRPAPQVGRLGFDDTMTVLSVEEPLRCRVAHTGRVVHGWGEFRLVELPDGTRLVWEEGVDVPGGPLAPLIWRVITPVVRVSFALALRRLARQIERS